MKKYFLMMALGLAVAGTSYAQDAPRRDRVANRTEQGRGDRDGFRRNQDKREKLDPEQVATRRTQMLTKKYDLSNSQERKLQALNLKHAQQLQSLRGSFAKGSERNGQHREQLKQLRTNWEKELKGILSKKQYTQYQEDRQQLQAKRGDRSGGREGQRDQARRARNS
ncbi:DUF4890 domain-containing protein [Rufibacter psychrotolerans]|uniref:DUF4890 domain-containing protein n=1 Tax=Rufibacter psychrotolerans TaxID=2812556 RepID=UPI001967B241|nr:DUF4890 domain-containing protein [Rufibacter sp. SYSU D00308]